MIFQIVVLSFVFLILTNLQFNLDTYPLNIVSKYFLKIEVKSNADIFAYGQRFQKNSVSGFDTGSYPVGITVNPFTNKIYVANQYSNTISVFDSRTDELKQTIETGIFPYSIDSNPFNNRIYVANRGSNDVSIVDGATDLLIDNVKVGKSPVQVVVDPTNNWIYVTNIDSNSISVIDGISNNVVKTINGTDSPYGISANPVSKKVYVTSLSNSTVSVLDAKNYKVIKNVKVGSAPAGIDVDMEKNIIFVSNYLSDSVSIINGTDDSVIKTVPVGNLPIGVKINPVSKKVYVSNIGSNTVSIINETSYKKYKDIPVNPSLIVERGNEYPYITPTNIKFPLLASFIGVDPLTNFVYVTNTASNAISVIDGKTDENIVRVSFQTQPVNAGFIECQDIKKGNQNTTTVIPTNKTSICNAVSERGYTFNSWSGLVASEENPLKFNSSEYGSIVAHFRPTLSYEQYLFIIGGVTGISSVFLGWFFKGRQRRTFNKFVQIVNQTVELSDFGNKKEAIIQFGNLRRTIFNSYRGGSLTDFQFDYLDKKIVNYIDKIEKI